MNNFEKFSSLHRQTAPLILPNAWDAASAKLIEQAGAQAIATTSAGVSWALGYPDGNGMTARHNVEAAKRIARVISLPLSVDFENGYSDDPSVVAENVKPLLDIGVAGINIEDGHDAPELLAEKIAAIRALTGKELYINARTDVYLAALVPAAERVAESVRRGKLYAAAGASGLFVPVVANGEDISAIAENTTLPLNILAMPGLPKADRLGNLGVKRISAGVGVSQAAWQATFKTAQAFLTTGESSVVNIATPVNLQASFSHE